MNLQRQNCSKIGSPPIRLSAGTGHPPIRCHRPPPFRRPPPSALPPALRPARSRPAVPLVLPASRPPARRFAFIPVSRNARNRRHDRGPRLCPLRSRLQSYSAPKLCSELSDFRRRRCQASLPSHSVADAANVDVAKRRRRARRRRRREASLQSRSAANVAQRSFVAIAKRCSVILFDAAPEGGLSPPTAHRPE